MNQNASRPYRRNQPPEGPRLSERPRHLVRPTGAAQWDARSARTKENVKMVIYERKGSAACDCSYRIFSEALDPITQESLKEYYYTLFSCMPAQAELLRAAYAEWLARLDQAGIEHGQTPLPAWEYGVTPRIAAPRPRHLSANEALQWRQRSMCLEDNVVMETYERRGNPFERSYRTYSAELDEQGAPVKEYRYHLFSCMPSHYKLMQSEYAAWVRDMEQATLEHEKTRRVYDLEPDYEADLGARR